MPDSLGADSIAIADLPDDWRRQESRTQQRGDSWHGALAAPLLRVPTAIVPLDGSPDMNMLINHRHPGAARIAIVSTEPFVLDSRLL